MSFPRVRDDKVCIWRNSWLPASETFIENQMAALSRWLPAPLGLVDMGRAAELGARTLFQGSGHLSGYRRKSIQFNPCSRRHLIEFLEDPSIRVIHAHFGPDAVDFLPFVKRVGKPLVVTFHGFDATAVRSKQTSGILRSLPYRELFAYSTKIVAVSDFIHESLLALGSPKDKTEVLPIGIPLLPAELEGEPRSGILFVGRLVEKKGLPDLLRAVASDNTLRQYRVDIVGDGPMRQQLEQFCFQNDVLATFHGVLSQREVAAMMRRAEVLCNPSKTARTGDSEGLGMIFLEAGRADLPVVSYRHGGVPEAVKDEVTGLLAEENDWVGLQQRLVRVLSDRVLRERLGHNGRVFVSEHFDIKKCTLRLEELYDGAAGKIPGRES